jgi:hypothetical protein
MSPHENPARVLWDEMTSVMSPYPDGVVPVPEPLSSTGFFPGGLGLWVEDSPGNLALPIDQIMIVGQDFNTMAAYNCARRIGSEVSTSPTWRRLLPIPAASGISPQDCFFTNVYMGLREQGKETGRFPGCRDQDFTERCLQFFWHQLEVLHPKLIITLGWEPFRALGKSVFKIAGPKSLSGCCEIYSSVPLHYGPATVVPLTHPSYYDVNVVRRHYKQLNGADAELAMIKAGMSTAFEGFDRLG